MGRQSGRRHWPFASVCWEWRKYRDWLSNLKNFPFPSQKAPFLHCTGAWRKADTLPLPSLGQHSDHHSSRAPAQAVPAVGLLRLGSLLTSSCSRVTGSCQAADAATWLLPCSVKHKLCCSHSNTPGEQQPSPIFPVCPYKFSQVPDTGCVSYMCTVYHSNDNAVINSIYAIEYA